MTRRSAGSACMISCQNNADEALPWINPMVFSPGVAGSSPTLSRMFTAKRAVGMTRDVMPSKSVIAPP